MFAVTILGNNSALPMHDRHPTAQVVNLQEQLFLIDCGEGTQIQMNRYKIRRNRIRHIFISHLHGDHYFGLPGLLTSYGLNGRKEDLWLYAPEPLKEILELQFRAAGIMLPYTLHFIPLKSEGILLDDKKLTISCFTVSHRIPCWGFLFKEKEKSLKLNPQKLQEYAIPASFYPRLKAGEDYSAKDGNIIKNEWVTQPAAAPLSYAYCADTAYDEAIAAKIKGVDLVYHEATYLADHEEKAFSRAHSTTRQAANIALLAQAKRLLIGHFSSKYEVLDDFLTEAKGVFENADLALEGATYLVHR
ncbi:MAG: ribonuclease Z [Chitinophagaceae bacterium]|nr:ribonuclease Z [Chitinophagaceae bacterium]